MEIKTAFEIGDLIWHKYSNNTPISKKKLWEDDIKFQVFQVMEIKSSTCYGGTQVFYEARPLHVLYKAEKHEGTISKRYQKTIPGWATDGKMHCIFREDELKLIDEAIKTDILSMPLAEE